MSSNFSMNFGNFLWKDFVKANLKLVIWGIPGDPVVRTLMFLLLTTQV